MFPPEKDGAMTRVTMQIRHGAGPAEVRRADTQALRDEFLVERLFVPGEVRMVYSHIDRMIVGGAMPTGHEAVVFGDGAAIGTPHLLSAREMGIVVFGGPGRVTVDDRVLDAEARDVVYLGRGAKEIRLQSRDPARPAKFYFNSCAAGVAHPHRVVTREQAEAVTLGDASRANVRTIRKYIQPGVCDSALLMLGITDPAPGSVWNTMPPHIHDRRMEAYFYFDMAPDDRVMHVMGLPGETRHLVVGPEEAVFSPAWSIHMGAGTGPYCFVWGMTGENQEYNDVLPVAPKDLR